MKYASKFMLVPYSKPIQNIEDNKVTNLDEEMGSILKNSNLDVYSKVKLYNKALSQFIKTYDENKFQVPPAIANLSDKLSFLKPEIKEEIETKVKQEIAENLNPEIKKEIEHTIKQEILNTSKLIKKDKLKSKKPKKIKLKKTEKSISTESTQLKNVPSEPPDFNNPLEKSQYEDTVNNLSLFDISKSLVENESINDLSAIMSQTHLNLGDQKSSNKHIFYTPNISNIVSGRRALKPVNIFQPGDPKNYGDQNILKEIDEQIEINPKDDSLISDPTYKPPINLKTYVNKKFIR